MSKLKKESLKAKKERIAVPLDSYSQLISQGFRLDEFYDNTITVLFKLKQGQECVIHTKGSDDSIANLIFKHMRGNANVRKHIFNAIKLYQASLSIEDDTVLYLQGLS